jgi:hypothetical protein
MSDVTVPRPSLPAALRWVNAAGALAARTGILPAALDPDAACAEARRRTGLSDFGAPYFRPALEKLLESANRDADLHFVGRRHLHGLVVRSLVTRLRLARAAPSADRARLRPPLLVCGLPRSGTTFLHRLLALAADARALRLWELMDPLPGPGRDRRRDDTATRLARLRRLSPANLDAQHFMRADLPDECGHLFKATFLSSLYAMVPATGYLAWYPQQDMHAAYRDYRRLLVLMTGDDGEAATAAAPARRLVLKDPFHAMSLPALFAAIPDAMVVQTHRAPSEVVPSFHKLTLTTQSVLAAKVDVPSVVATNTTWLETVARRSVDDRARVPAGQVIDIDYRALIADPVGTARWIHDRFDLGWSDALEAELAAFVRANGQRKHGDNPYAAPAFGQTASGIDERFAAYRATFL